MKKIFLSFLLALLCTSLFSCNSSQLKQENDDTFYEEIGALNHVNRANLKNSSYVNLDQEILDRINAFANRLSEEYLDVFDLEDNFSISPISVYFAFSCLYPTVEDDVREELTEKLGITYVDAMYTKTLMEQLYLDEEEGGKIYLTNSIWIQEGLKTDKTILDNLASNYYCHAFSADFFGNNVEANKNIREFIKKNTQGLIDQDFDISSDTFYALINTLYLNDNWLDNGLDLALEGNKFHNYNGDIVESSFLVGKYFYGMPIQTDTYQMFYTKTSSLKVSIVLPNKEVDVKRLYTSELLTKMQNAEYNGEVVDVTAAGEIYKRYYTSLIFPAFEANSDQDIIAVIQNMGVNKIFAPYYSKLVDDLVVIDKIQHVTKLDVNKKGIEGAAVTIIANKATSTDPSQNVYQELLIDRPFIYMIEYRGVNLFTGICYNIKK